MIRVQITVEFTPDAAEAEVHRLAAALRLLAGNAVRGDESSCVRSTGPSPSTADVRAPLPANTEPRRQPIPRQRAQVEAPAEPKKPPTRADLILELMAVNPRRVWRLDEVCRQLGANKGVNHEVARQAMGKLLADGRIRRVGRGQYELYQAAP